MPLPRPNARKARRRPDVRGGDRSEPRCRLRISSPAYVQTAEAARPQLLDVLRAGLSSPFPRACCAMGDPQPISLREPGAAEVLTVDRSSDQLRAIRSCP